MKQYTKPALYYESFALTEAIARTCIEKGNHSNESTCAWFSEDFGESIFITDLVNDCAMDWIDFEGGESPAFSSN